MPPQLTANLKQQPWSVTCMVRLQKLNKLIPKLKAKFPSAIMVEKLRENQFLFI